MSIKRSLAVACASLALAAALPATAAAVVDPSADLLATYTGPQNGDLDILAASVAFDGTNFRLSATVDGPVGTSAGSLYVFGINRGSGSPRLTFGSPSVGAGVLFDAVAVLFPSGLGRTAAFPLMGPPTITPLPGAVTVDGDTISGLFPLALLPSMGAAPEDYAFTLWSRRRENPALDGTNAEIADFAGDAIRASVPEPAAWALMIAGFGLAGAAVRRRRELAATP